MKKLTISLIMIWQFGNAQTFPVQSIKNTGANTKRINIAIMGDGYLSTQQGQFITDATGISNSIFTQSPFLEYANFFNVYGIKVPSAESGAKHPGNATDVAEPASPVTNPNNYFGSTFDYASIHRLLVPNSTTAFNTLINNFPEYDQAFVLVNSNVYGGSGGAIATSSTDPSAAEVAIHEIGHSFGFLADEYEIGGQGEKANRTTNTNPATVKWKNWLGFNEIGIYPIGVEGYQRPHQTCKMRYLGYPFCSVCKEAFISRIYSLVSPIDNFLPVNNMVNFTGNSMNFSLGLILPIPNTLNIKWQLNGMDLATDVNNINVLASNLAAGTNTLVATVTDNTSLSRVPNPPPGSKVASINGYVNSVSWQIVQAPLSVQFLDFTIRVKENNAELNWKTANENNSDYFEVQKSTDGSSFVGIGNVKSLDNSKEEKLYSFIDYNPSTGATYYRIMEVGFNGQKMYSKIKVINLQEKRHFEIYPNPVIDKMNIVLNAENQEDIELTLLNTNGVQLKVMRFNKVNDVNEQLNMNEYPAGNYRLNVKMGGISFQKNIIKL